MEQAGSARIRAGSSVYLPTHQEGASGFSALIALIAAVYAAGVVIAAPRVARAAALRLGGRPWRVVLIGIGGEELHDPAIPARWRALAIAAGAFVSLVTLAAGLHLASHAVIGTFPHAVAAVAASAALFSVVATFLPAPPLVGWSLLLTALDLAGTRRAARIRTAALIGRLVATPLIVAAVAGLAPRDLWMAIPIGLLAVVHVWRVTTLEVGRDALTRFLEVHTVGGIAGPPVLRVRPDEAVASASQAGDLRGAVFIEEKGLLVGAIGSHRLRLTGPGNGRRMDVTWRQCGVPIARLPRLHTGEPAVRLIEMLRASGVVLVLVGGEIQAVEEDQLFDRTAGWVRAGDKRDGRRKANGTGPVPAPHAGSRRR